MGLDNIPHRYPCKTAGTAILNEELIDCNATIDARRCPWANAQLGKGALYGPFGTWCWYRGKAGTWMIQALQKEGATLPDHLSGGFYGDGDRLTPDYCRQLADWLEEHGELYLSTVPDTDRHHEAAAYRYAVRWLRWVADHCDGADAWW